MIYILSFIITEDGAADPLSFVLWDMDSTVCWQFAHSGGRTAVIVLELFCFCLFGGSLPFTMCRH